VPGYPWDQRPRPAIQESAPALGAAAREKLPATTPTRLPEAGQLVPVRDERPLLALGGATRLSARVRAA
jgi:hypothetical protein